MTEVFAQATGDDDLDPRHHKSLDGIFPKKESIDDIRARMLHSVKWLDKAVALMKTKQPEEVTLAFWMNKEHTLGCPAGWCGLDPEFQAETFILTIPSSYQPTPEEMPTYMVHGHQHVGAAAICEHFEMYGVTNGSIPYYQLFGFRGESMYDIMFEDENDRDLFIGRVGMFKQERMFEFEERFGEALLTKD